MWMGFGAGPDGKPLTTERENSVRRARQEKDAWVERKTHYKKVRKKMVNCTCGRYYHKGVKRCKCGLNLTIPTV